MANLTKMSNLTKVVNMAEVDKGLANIQMRWQKGLLVKWRLL